MEHRRSNMDIMWGGIEECPRSTPQGRFGSLNSKNRAKGRDSIKAAWATVPGDFEVNEERYAFDVNYRAAVDYMEKVSPCCVSRKAYFQDGKYRKAISMVTSPDTDLKINGDMGSLIGSLEAMTQAVTKLESCSTESRNNNEGGQKGKLSKTRGLLRSQKTFKKAAIETAMTNSMNSSIGDTTSVAPSQTTSIITLGVDSSCYAEV